MKYILILILGLLIFGCNKKTATTSDQSILESLDPTLSPPTELTYSGSSSLVLKVGQAMTEISPTFTAKSNLVLFRTSPTLPAGLSLNSLTGVISGTPLEKQENKDYVLSVVNNGGAATYLLHIQINDVAPSGLTYAQSKYSISLGTNGTVISPSGISGGSVDSYSINPALLPDGLFFDTATGTISGRPYTAMAEKTYTISATNSGGSTSTLLKIEVVGYAPNNLTYQNMNIVLKAGKDAVTNYPIYAGDPATHFSVSPALPEDMSINSLSGVISGIPAIASNQDYIITASNSWGSTSSTIKIITQDYINGLSTGRDHSCVLKNKFIYCFGRNDLKQLGAESSDICVDSLSQPINCSKNPLNVLSYNGQPLKVKKIVSSNNANCALTFDNKVMCFGSNVNGQLGIGSMEQSLKIPTTVIDSNGNELTNVSDVQSGSNHFCAKSNSLLYCWGDNSFGQLGNLVLLESNKAITAKNENNDVQVDTIGVGYNHVCFSKNNTIKCFGSNNYGQLGTGNQQSQLSMVQPSFDSGLSLIGSNKIVLGNTYSLFEQSGNYYSFGFNNYGEASNGTTNPSFNGSLMMQSLGQQLPLQEKIFNGDTSFCMIKDGIGQCVGRNDFNFGNFENLNIANVFPIQILDELGSAALTGINEISNGYSSHRCVAKSNFVYCFGKNQFGQIGNDYIDHILPRLISIP